MGICVIPTHTYGDTVLSHIAHIGPSWSNTRLAMIRPDGDVRMGMDLYSICTRATRLQAKGWRCYLSQNIGLAVAGSAGPTPPPLPNHDFWEDK